MNNNKTGKRKFSPKPVIIGTILGDYKKIIYSCPECGCEITFCGDVETKVEEELCSKCKGGIN